MQSADDSKSVSTNSTEADDHRKIPFPFEPYDVQRQLMRKIYDTLEKGGIGIFESPTGTGKSLSVICSALQWLKDAEARDVEERPPADNANQGASGEADRVGDSDGGGEGAKLPSWLKNYSRNKAKEESDTRARRMRDRRAELDRRLEEVRGRPPRGLAAREAAKLRGRSVNWKASGSGGGPKRPRTKNASSNNGSREMSRVAPPGVGGAAGNADAKAGSGEGGEDEEFLVAEYASGGEGAASAGSGARESSSDEEDAKEKGWDDQDEWKDLGLRQILYCSRTHSQTSQFVNEVRKTVFAESVRCVSLGSRRTLCGNEAVSKLKSDARMAEACLELQKKKKNKSKGSKRKAKARSKSGASGSKKRKLAGLVPGGRAGRYGTDQGEKRNERKGDHANEEDGDDGDDDGDDGSVTEGENDGCPLLHPEGRKEFPFRALASVRDIEELAELGRQEGSCAYYGTRKAASLAQLVVMPYAALLSPETRAALGVRLEGSVVVIDEAHNLVEAINSVNSKRLALSEVARAHSQLCQYEARYGKRLKGANAFYVGNILRLLRVLLKFLTKGRDKLKAARGEAGRNCGKDGSGARDQNGTAAHVSRSGRREDGQGFGNPGSGAQHEVWSEMLETNDFLFRARADNLNIFKMRRYMRNSEISKKVMGFLDMSSSSFPGVALNRSPTSETSSAPSSVGGRGGSGASSPVGAAGGDEGDESTSASSAAFVGKHVSSLQVVEGFLDALTNSSRDGRVLVTYGSKPGEGGGRSGNRDQKTNQEDEEPSVKFLMLNPSVHFDEIVKKVRAVILIGGTMQPTGDLVRQLFATTKKEVDVFSCGHVIPKENLLPLCVPRGPSSKTFDFTFHRRSTDEQVDELGRLLANVCKLVPGGIVCFLPSYGYLDQVLKRWKTSGTLRQLSRLKSLFSEPRLAKDVDAVLKEFSLVARAGGWKPGGGVHSSGSGGDPTGGLLLSVVGAKMSEGINFSDDLARCVVMVGLPYPDKRDPELREKMAYLDSADPGSHGKSGREYYSNICMRAVNQSIGRSIRHAEDYASILLVDARYQDDQVIRLLPGWIAERVVRPANFRDVFVALRRFLADMHVKRAA